MIGHNHLGKNGRFGNQMFQYASTRGIAAARGYDFIIPDGPRTDEEFYDEENQHKLFMAFKMSGLKNVGLLKAPYKQESSFGYDKELVKRCPDDINLYGYFQSERYFWHIENEIRQDFTWRDDVWNTCKEIFDQVVPEGKAISLHVRRTDQVEKKDYHYLQTDEYFAEALSKLPQDIPVIVFSDEPKWCQNSNLFEDDRFLISESSDNIHDMCLMSMCQYHIIAASTFSWWGAWLAKSEKVICPKNWFGPSSDVDDKDLVPDGWERI